MKVLFILGITIALVGFFFAGCDVISWEWPVGIMMVIYACLWYRR